MTDNDRRKNVDLLVSAIASGATNRDAAVIAGLSESTVQRRLAEPEVRAMIADARQEFRRRTMDRLVSLNTKAVDRLERLLDDEDTPPGVLARLIDMTLSQSQRWVEVEELRERVDRIISQTPDDIAARVRAALQPIEDGEAA
jgi:hypothetical protein